MMTQRGRTGWRRWVVRGAVCVVLGVLTTVGVAWGLEVARPKWLPYRCIDSSVSTSQGTWEIIASARRGLATRAVRYQSRWVTILGSELVSFIEVATLAELPHGGESWGEIRVERVRELAGKREILQGFERGAGWPFLALWWTRNDGPHPLGSEQTPPAQACFGGVRLYRDADIWDDVVLPWYPILPGLAMDSLIYGVGWMMLLSTPGVWKRFRREAVWRRRGRCPRCGYDLVHKFDAGCPECGWNRA